MSYEEVRGTLLKTLYRTNGVMQGQSEAVIDAILSAKYPNGQLMVALLSEDQTIIGGMQVITNLSNPYDFRRIVEKP